MANRNACLIVTVPEQHVLQLIHGNGVNRRADRLLQHQLVGRQLSACLTSVVGFFNCENPGLMTLAGMTSSRGHANFFNIVLYVMALDH